MIKQFDKVATHKRPDLDEIAAEFLARKTGVLKPNAERILVNAGPIMPDGRTGDAWQKDGILVLGTGRSLYDEHREEVDPHGGEDSCVTLFAKGFDLYEEFYEVLNAIKRSDQSAGDAPFDLPALIKNMHMQYPEDPDRVVNWAFKACEESLFSKAFDMPPMEPQFESVKNLDSRFLREYSRVKKEEDALRLKLQSRGKDFFPDRESENRILGLLHIAKVMLRRGESYADTAAWMKAGIDAKDFVQKQFVLALEELRRGRQEKKVSVIPVNVQRQTIYVVVVKSDNERMSAAARSEEGGKALGLPADARGRFSTTAVVIQKNSRGNVVVLPNQYHFSRMGLSLIPAAVTIRKLEEEAALGRSVQRSIVELAQDGIAPGSENWMLFVGDGKGATQMIFNGTPKSDQIPTRLSLGVITGQVCSSLDGSMAKLAQRIAEETGRLEMMA